MLTGLINQLMPGGHHPVGLLDEGVYSDVWLVGMLSICWDVRDVFIMGGQT